MTPTRSCLVALAGLALLATQTFGQYNAPCESMPFNGMIPAKPIPPVAPIPGGDPRAALFGGNAGQAGCGCNAGPASCGCMAGPAPMVPPGRGPMPYQAGLWQPVACLMLISRPWMALLTLELPRKLCPFKIKPGPRPHPCRRRRVTTGLLPDQHTTMGRPTPAPMAIVLAIP